MQIPSFIKLYPFLLEINRRSFLSFTADMGFDKRSLVANIFNDQLIPLRRIIIRSIGTFKRIVFDIGSENRKQNHLSGIGIRRLVPYDPIVSADIAVHMKNTVTF